MNTIKRLRVNEQIRIPQVLLIDEQGNSLGIKSNFEAKQIASDRGYDLVEVAPAAQPPVCRLLDYGKFQYEQEKAQKKQKTITVKEIRLSLKIEGHDWQTKLKKAKGFLAEGHKVKIAIRLTGRELGFVSRALEEAEKFKNDCDGEFEETPKKLGKQVIGVIHKLKV